MCVLLALALGCDKGDAAKPSAAVASADAEPELFEPIAPASAEETPPPGDAAAAPRPRLPPAKARRRPEPSGAEKLFSDYGFPVVSAVEHLCGKRDYPVSGGHLTWDAFATDVAPAELVARYEKRLTDRGLEREKNGGSWRLPAGAPTTRTLSVMAPGDQGPHRSCSVKPSTAAKSVIVLSRR